MKISAVPLERRLMLRGVVFLCLCFFCVSPSAFAAGLVSDNLDSSGYLKSYALWQDQIKPTTDALWQSQNSARLMFGYFTEHAGNMELHYEFQPIYQSKPSPFLTGSGLSSTVGAIGNRYRYKDINNDYGDGSEHWIYLHNLDRLNYQYRGVSGDLTLGRQVVSFGSARFINPTDIFVPFALQTLNQEYRVGIDALRYQMSLGDFALLDSGIVIGEDAKKQNNAAFVRGRDNWNGNDVQVVLIAQDRAWLFGGGVETALGDFGFWFETAYAESDVSYWRHSIGFDYALNENLITMVEYHYNGAGARSEQDYPALLLQQPYQRGGVYLLGQHYIIPSLSWQFTPLIHLSASAFCNVSDQSQFISVAAEVSWSDDLVSDVGLYVSQGDDLIVGAAGPTDLQFGSEFGHYPSTLYASLRYYF